MDEGTFGTTGSANRGTIPRGYVPGQTNITLIDAWGQSHRGNRDVNRDQFLVAGLGTGLCVKASSCEDDAVPIHTIRNPAAHLLVVADGIGEQPGAALASAIVIHSLVDFFDDATAGETGWLTALEEAIQWSNDRVFKHGESHPSHRGLASTVTAAIVVNDAVLIAHVGDSRAYRFRDGELKQLTRDHTLAVTGSPDRKQSGRATAGHWGPFEQVPTNVVGGFDSEVTIETHVRSMSSDDLVLLCTRGITRSLPKWAIQGALRRAGSCRELAGVLVEAALLADEADNVTAVIGRCGISVGPAYAELPAADRATEIA